ncbi:Mycosubtilin synthase subunit A [Orchesella cincta]|uniref:Mycosubtilin synthase subunit A n=1 Tax=Orchesella cincta TaxID=48709 RepID=A0A1D2MCA2_ORCCI|nr:Mycosubtilin synthase subunit A [Orchesella cincta]
MVDSASGNLLGNAPPLPAEKYADSPSNQSLKGKGPPSLIIAGGSIQSMLQQSDPVKINVDEIRSILELNSGDDNQSATNEKEELVKKSEPDETGSACLWKCLKCQKTHKGILQGSRKSIPNKIHVIQHWRKQLNNRINQKKLAILVDANNDSNVTYQELDEFSNCIAYKLKKLKFTGRFENHNPQGELVIAMCHPACYEYIVIILAILKLGAAFLPISYELPAERIAEIVKLTRPVLTIINAEQEDLFETVGSLVEMDVLLIDDIWGMLEKGVNDQSLIPFRDPIQSPDPAKPYPPMWKRTVAIAVVPSESQELQANSYDSRAFLNRMEWENHFFVFLTSEFVLAPPTYDTIDSLADILTALTVGVTLVVLASPNDFLQPDQLFSYCKTYKVRRLTMWPSLLRSCTFSMQLFEDLVQQVYTVRYWFVIGGLLRIEMAEMFFELAPPLALLVHMYQFEDCLGALAFHVYECGGNAQNQNFYSRLPVGFPVPNTDIYILGPDMKPVKDGNSGTIYLTGVQLPRLKKNELEKIASAAYLPNPFSNHKDRQVMIKTTDIGRITKRNGGTRVLIHEITKARYVQVSNQIVWLSHIEVYLRRVPHLVKKNHCICYRPHEEDQILVAFCVLAKGVTVVTVDEELRLCLPGLMVPEVISVKEIPLIPDSQIPDENSLLKMYQELRQEGKNFDNWEVLKIGDPHILRAAKILAYVVYTYLGIGIGELVEKLWNWPFVQLRHANMCKGVYIVKELHRNRYPIYIDDFLWALDLNAISVKMVEARKDRGFCNNRCPADEVLFVKNRYRLEVMMQNTRGTICSLLAKCFTQRDQLDYFAEVNYLDMRKFFDSTWPLFVSKKLSIVIRKKKEKNRVVGAVLCMSWHDEIKITSNAITPNVSYKIELIQFLEAGLTDEHFPQDRTNVLQICYLGLDASQLTSYEIHGLTDKIIRSMLIVSKVRGFDALVMIAFDFFSLDICVNTYDFLVAKECQVNQFVASDGTRPYELCPDSLVSAICWKPLSKIEETHSPEKKTVKHKTLTFAHEHKKPWNDK